MIGGDLWQAPRFVFGGYAIDGEFYTHEDLEALTKLEVVQPVFKYELISTGTVKIHEPTFEPFTPI